MADVGELLSKVTEQDLKLDRLGRVVVTNPEVIRAIREAAELDMTAAEEAAGNGICCGNGVCASPELVGIFERLVSGRSALPRG